MAVAALAISGAVAISAQTSQRTKAQVVTVSGCLLTSKDAPGVRKPALESATMTTEYVLTNVKMAGSSSSSAIGLAARYKVDGIADAELQQHLNHQVELIGSITPMTAREELPQLHATALKMISPTCTAAQ
jgi:hypothetical protein